MIDFNALDQQLRDTFADQRLDNTERDELRQLGTILDPEQIRFMRNRAFDMVNEIIANPAYDINASAHAFRWLRQVIKTLDQSQPQQIQSTAHFTPGESCRKKIISLCNQAQHNVDICVFTISDNTLSQEIIKAHRRGIKIRIITDNDKQYDAGSDIHLLQEAKIPLVTDQSEYHMHHKFAIFDRKILLNGSFNWTTSASNFNSENILTTDNTILVEQYIAHFEKLWERYQ